MNKLQKLIRANELRRTRFHTERGELLPASAVGDAVRSAMRRAGMGPQDPVPWLVPSAVTALSDLLDPRRSRILELGAGTSTLWFAPRVASVLSWEADPAWADAVRRKLADAALTHVTVRDIAIDEMVAAMADEPREHFDVVVVDCLETPRTKRLDLLEPGAGLVRPGGRLVLDDSDRRHLWPAPERLSGWQVDRHIGIKQFPLMAVETTIFRKPPVQPGGPGAGTGSARG